MEGLLKAYKRFVALPWTGGIAAQQRVWFALYEPHDERRLRLRIGAFEEVTIRAGHGWLACNLTDEFAHWMASQEYRESYFESPDTLVRAKLSRFADHVADVVRRTLESPEANEGTVFAIYGVSSLFGLVRVSYLLEKVSPCIRGRLLVFFPGEYDNGNYRLLDARDGWNYLAIPISAQEGAR
ncbi:MAG: DUF1788 domain-containing protein [Actinomycetota bacterium]|nr:DUF1788 domain-containing protein [Actinomycetota bacterium]